MITDLLSNAPETGHLTEPQQQTVARQLAQITRTSVYEPSVSVAKGNLLALARDGRTKRLLVVAEPGRLGPFQALARRRGAITIENQASELATIDLKHEAARAVRRLLPWTAPKMGGLSRSAGLGDRLGLATPGHVRAVQAGGCVPYFAQQSIREMSRTQRTPEQVMDDASWGVFQAGWREGFGSDADHLKNPGDVDLTDAVGFTMFTIDPGDHVRSEADTLDASDLASAMEALPWDDLKISAADFRKAYTGKSFALEGGPVVTFDEDTLARAAIKYTAAVTHTAMMFRHLKDRRGERPFELEVSVDETATPTTAAEHYLIAAELKRLGVQWVSLAPRFVGEFEKGIDYKGDLAAFERTYNEHLAVARTLGPYKLSIHSGSDKFAIYPIAARLSGELVHLKTAGTSYLEALRVAARARPDLFRRILNFAFTRFDEDRATYHISAQVEAVPRADTLADAQLESVLNGNDGRQLLHVTYGSVLTATKDDGSYRFRNQLLETLIDNEEQHYAVLAEHLGKHVQPFAR